MTAYILHRLHIKHFRQNATLPTFILPPLHLIYNSIYVLTDFDRTITVGNSESSWSILSKSNMVPKEYVEERQAFFNYYRPFEIDETLEYETKIKLMTEWWNKHIGLFVKYRLSEEVINNAAQNLRVMSFREGAKEFLENMKD